MELKLINPSDKSKNKPIEINSTCVITNYDPRAKKPSQEGDLTVFVEEKNSTIMKGKVFQEDSTTVNFNEIKHSVFTKLASYDGDDSNLTLDDLDKAYQEKDNFKEFIINLGVKEVSIRFDSHAGVMTIEFGNEVLRIDFKTWWERWGFVEDSSELAIEETDETQETEPVKKSEELTDIAKDEIDEAVCEYEDEIVDNVDRSYEGFKKLLAERESSSNSSRRNSYNYIGLYQFGKQALAEVGLCKKNENNKYTNDNYEKDFLKNNKYCKQYGIRNFDDFVKNKNNVQDAVLLDHMKINWKVIESMGLDQYIGEEINGQIITESGLLAAAHLKGVGPLKTYLKYKGKPYYTNDGEKMESDDFDRFGTKISTYMSEFAGYDVDEITNLKAKQKNIQFNNSMYAAIESLNPGIGQDAFCRYHKVVRGDNLYDIAMQYNEGVSDFQKVTVTELLTFNNLKNSKLKIGQIIKIPYRFSYEK